MICHIELRFFAASLQGKLRNDVYHNIYILMLVNSNVTLCLKLCHHKDIDMVTLFWLVQKKFVQEMSTVVTRVDFANKSVGTRSFILNVFIHVYGLYYFCFS